jgi:hypothetical protein
VVVDDVVLVVLIVVVVIGLFLERPSMSSSGTRLLVTVSVAVKIPALG